MSKTRIFPALVFLAVALPPHAAGAEMNKAAPVLTSDVATATAGSYRLAWQWDGPPSTDFELQESRDDDFRSAVVVYRGPDQASVMSGRANGRFFYRVRAVTDGDAGKWSATAMVTVEHHPLSRAFAFFSAGAMVFIATLGLIVAGSLAARRR